MDQLKDCEAFSGFSVNDIDAAKTFYGDVLGLDVSQDPEMGILTIKLAGGSRILLYPKPNHEPATYTTLNFPVPNIEETVAALKSRGVAFESYDTYGLKTDENNINRSGGPLIAWFKDPAGNILSIIEHN